MTDSEAEDDGWEQGSRDEKQSEDSEEGTDDVQEVEALGSRVSVKPILSFPERNDEDTFWTRTDETKTASVKKKFKSEDITRVRQHKEIQWTEVVKNDPTSLVDHWLWDHIKSDRWDHIVGVFPKKNLTTLTNSLQIHTQCYTRVTRVLHTNYKHCSDTSLVFGASSFDQANTRSLSSAFNLLHEGFRNDPVLTILL
jgi:hypothetical protein